MATSVTTRIALNVLDLLIWVDAFLGDVLMY
jgi:hypothetical protein